jgi:hypothetical protein
MSKREWSASDQIQRHGDEAICSCPALCLIGDGGNLTSHSVCRHIDDRGIDFDSINCGVDGLNNNSVDGDSVSGSIGSLERCIHTIDTSLSTWSQESHEYLAEIAKNIKEWEIIYWVQGLWPNPEKSLALGKRGLEGLDRAIFPSANFNDRILKPVAARLHAKMVYCNIRDVCIRDGVNCLPATHEEAKRLAEVISVIAKLVHQKKPNSSFRTAVGNLSRIC